MCCPAINEIISKLRRMLLMTNIWRMSGSVALYVILKHGLAQLWPELDCNFDMNMTVK